MLVCSYHRALPQLLATSATATLAGKDLPVTRISMNAQATLVKMEEPALMALMDLHAPAHPSGLAYSVRPHSKVLTIQEDIGER